MIKDQVGTQEWTNTYLSDAPGRAGKEPELAKEAKR
jgi:hypothetical protein